MTIDEKRGQIKLSFGMIFSIILIIIFLIFAFYGIKMILNFQKEANIGKFVNDLQNDVNKMWQNSGSQIKTYILPKNIEEVCFNEDSKIYFKPFGTGGEFDYMEIKHLDVKEPFCIKNNGKIKIRIKRDEDVLVTIEESE